MNHSTNSYNISSEHLLLVEMLKRMYNDNINQLNSMTNSINNIRNTNSQIRNLLVEILYNPNTNANLNFGRTNRSSYRHNSRLNSRFNSRLNSGVNSRLDNRSLTNAGNLGRVILDNVPYVIDSIQQYRIPFTQSNVNNSTSNTTEQERNTNFSRIAQNFFQPIEVYPTQSQIESATRNVRYCDIINPINRSCPISLQTFTDNDMVSVIRFCGHIFNTEQLSLWFRSNCRCPLCRYDIRNYNSNTSTFFNQTNSISEEEQTSRQENIDASNNYTEQNRSSLHNEERNMNASTNANANASTNTNVRYNNLTNYLDLFLDDTLMNDISNATNNADINTISSLFTNIQRRMS